MSEIIKISNEKLCVKISTLGAEIKSILMDNKERMWDGNPDIWAGQAPLLFPVCGALRDNKFVLGGKEYNLSKHGFAKTSEFKVEMVDSDTVTFLLCSSNETLEKYPFKFELRVTYTLVQNTIKVDYAVKNADEKLMYYSIGAHEAYACPEGIENYSIVFEKTEILKSNMLEGACLSREKELIAENCKELPLKQEYFKIDALILTDIKSRKASIRNLASGEIVTEVDFNGFDYLLIWTKPNAPYICIEPWCGIPDFADGDYDITKKPGIIEVGVGEESLRTHSITMY